MTQSLHFFHHEERKTYDLLHSYLKEIFHQTEYGIITLTNAAVRTLEQNIERRKQETCMTSMRQFHYTMLCDPKV